MKKNTHETDQKIDKCAEIANKYSLLGDNAYHAKEFQQAIKFYQVSIDSSHALLKLPIINKDEIRRMVSFYYVMQGECMSHIDIDKQAEYCEGALRQWPDNIYAAFKVAKHYFHEDRERAVNLAYKVVDRKLQKEFELVKGPLPIDRASRDCHTMIAYDALEKNNLEVYDKHALKANIPYLANLIAKTDLTKAKELAKSALMKNKEAKYNLKLDQNEIIVLKEIWGESILQEVLPLPWTVSFKERKEEYKESGKEPTISVKFIDYSVEVSLHLPKSLSKVVRDSANDTSTLDSNTLLQLNIAIALFKQAEALGSKNAARFLYYIYRTDSSPVRNEELANIYVQNWASHGDFEALAHLCLYHCRDIDAFKNNYQLILDNISIIEKGIKDYSLEVAPTDDHLNQVKAVLAALYSKMRKFAIDSTPKDINLYEQKTCHYSINERFQFAIRCLASGKRSDLDKAIRYFKYIAREKFYIAHALLGIIYFAIEGMDLNKSEQHFKIAYANGIEEAGQFLYLVLMSKLDSISDDQDPQYKAIALELSKLKFAFVGDSFEKKSQLVFNADLKQIQHKISELYLNRRGNPFLQIKAILQDSFQEDSPVLKGSLYYSLAIFAIGKLIEFCKHNDSLFLDIKPDIKKLLSLGLKALPVWSFSTNSICSAISGVAKFSTFGYSKLFGDFIKVYCRHIIDSKIALNNFYFNWLLSSLIRLPLTRNFMTFELNEITQQALNQCEQYIQEGQEISGILYHFAVLSNLKRIFPELQLKHFRADELKPLIMFALSKILDDQISSTERHQYFLAVLYFCNYYKSFENIDRSILQKYSQNKEKENIAIRCSLSQMKVYNYLSKYFSNIEPEYVINTIPVDMFLPNEGVIIQFNGPLHFIQLEEGLIRRAKDHFHDVIFNAPLILADESSQKSSYKIIHIDYKQFEQEGFQYVDNQLEQFGLLTTGKDFGEKEGRNYSYSMAVVGVFAQQRRSDGTEEQHTHGNSTQISRF